MDQNKFIRALEEVKLDFLEQVYFKDICPSFVASELYSKAEVDEILKLSKNNQIEEFLNKLMAAICNSTQPGGDSKWFYCLVDALSDRYDSIGMKLQSALQKQFSAGSEECDTNAQYQTLDDELIKLMFELELDKYLPIFQKQEIDYQTLLQASKDDIKELIPKLGPRIKLWEKLEQIRKQSSTRIRVRVGSKRNRPHSQTM